jgi:hypothetical protein
MVLYGIVFPQILADFNADMRTLAWRKILRKSAGESAFICGKFIGRKN